MTDEKIERLNSINFDWGHVRQPKTQKAPPACQFDKQFPILVSFKETYGHCKVNKLIKEWKKGTSVPERKEYRRLGVFMAAMRKEHLLFLEGKPCSLDEEKVRMLTELGVEWKKPGEFAVAVFCCLQLEFCSRIVLTLYLTLYLTCVSFLSSSIRASCKHRWVRFSEKEKG